MNDHHLSAFVTVVDCGSISKAAKRLFITPQALAQQINLVERECSAKLLERTSNGVVLTAEGRTFYAFAVESLERGTQMLHAIREIQERQADTVRIGATVGPPSNIAMSVRHEFFQTHPGYRQEIVELNILKRLDGLADGLVDVVEYADSPAIEERGLRFRRLGEGQLVIMSSVDHPLAKKPLRDLADLAGQTIQVFDWDYYRSAIEAHPEVDFVRYDHTSAGFTEEFYADILAHCQAGSAFLAVKGNELYNTQISLFQIELSLLEDTITLGLAYSKEASEAVRRFVDFTALCTSATLI